MLDPAVLALTASAIVDLACKKFFEESAAELGKKFTAEAIAKMDTLRKRLWAKLRGRSEKLDQALDQVEKGDRQGLQTVTKNLDVVLDEDDDFAAEVKALAQEINAGKLQDNSSMTQNVTVDNNTNIQAKAEQGGTNYYAQTINQNHQQWLDSFELGTRTKLRSPNNLRQRSLPYFVGRKKELARLHESLQRVDRLCVSAVSGMGGIGKTELVLQYVWLHERDYPAGILWLSLGEVGIAEEIVSFGRSPLKIVLPENLTLLEKVNLVWSEWPGTDPALIVVDNLHTEADYDEIQPFLEHLAGRFRVLLTSRVKLAGLENLSLDVLSLAGAVELLERLAKTSDRRGWDKNEAEKLCEWLGLLPLGVALVGSYLGGDLSLTLADVTRQLEKWGLDARCMTHPEPTIAKRGIKAAIALSWDQLTQETQHFACFLSLFACAPIEWRLIESALGEIDPDDALDFRRTLIQLHLLQTVEQPEQNLFGYKLHSLIWEFLREKVGQMLEAQTRRDFVKAVVEEAEKIEHHAPLSDLEKVRLAIPHITEVAEIWTADLADKDVITPCMQLGRYYKTLVDYAQTEYWYSKNVALAKQRLPENSPDIASALNNLANLYRSQGKYPEAQPLLLAALAIARESLPKNHPDLATYLNNLALLYASQGEYSEAEHLYLEALAINRESLPKNHPDLATNINNLALLYKSQGKYPEAQPLLLEALAIARESLPKNHPDLATNINNLANLYASQGKYPEAEPLYLEALAIDGESLPKNHPSLATSLNNLAYLYESQGKYQEAEPLYLEALAIFEESLGTDHPNTRTCRANYEKFLQQKGDYQ